jgi:hypothetical protein
MNLSLRTHRHSAFDLLPPWARQSNLYRYIYAAVILLDALYDMLLGALRIRFPGEYSEESDAQLSAERRLWRSPNESAASFAARLRNWWDVAKHCGTFYSLALRVQEYLLPATWAVTIATQNGGRLYTLAANGTYFTSSSSWDWDGDSTAWSRFWVILENEHLGVSGTALYLSDFAGRKLGRGAYDIGHNRPWLNRDTSLPPDHAAIRRLIEAYRTPSSLCEGIILVLDHDAFWTAMPDGDWQYWANRNTHARYWAGTPR